MVPFHQLFLGSEFKMVKPGFSSPWKFVTRNLHLQCHIGHSGNCFPCLSMCICQHSWHPKSKGLGINKLINNCHYIAFSDLLDNGHCISFTNLAYAVSDHCNASLNTVPTEASLNHLIHCQTVLTSTLSWPYTSSKQKQIYQPPRIMFFTVFDVTACFGHSYWPSSGAYNT
jgi:hypothetical protein